MDKYEYNLKFDQMKSLCADEDYEAAAEIADSMNWNKIRNVNALVKAGEIYEHLERYEDSRNVLLMAYDRSPIGRTILYRLAEVSIKMGDFTAATEYYNEFVELAPHDNLRYTLRYHMKKAQGADPSELIPILEELKELEYTEEWAYELAYLYHQAGMGDKCVEACDELILWFGDGTYVERALELKMLYQPLTKAQEEKYRKFQQDKQGVTTISAEEMERAGEYVHDPVAIPQVDVNVNSKFNTMNLQEEIAKGIQQIIAATEKETVTDTMDSIKKIVEDIPYLQLQMSDTQRLVGVQQREAEAEIDGSIRSDFAEMLGDEEEMAQVAEEPVPEEYSQEAEADQSTISDVLDEWERTRRAAEAALQVAEQRKLETAKAMAIQEAEDLMARLNEVIPKLDAGVSPQELLKEEYRQRAEEAPEEEEPVFDFNAMMMEESEPIPEIDPVMLGKMKEEDAIPLEDDGFAEAALAANLAAFQETLENEQPPIEEIQLEEILLDDLEMEPVEEAVETEPMEEAPVEETAAQEEVVAEETVVEEEVVTEEAAAETEEVAAETEEAAAETEETATETEEAAAETEETAIETEEAASESEKISAEEEIKVEPEAEETPSDEIVSEDVAVPEETNILSEGELTVEEPQPDELAMEAVDAGLSEEEMLAAGIAAVAAVEPSEEDLTAAVAAALDELDVPATDELISEIQDTEPTESEVEQMEVEQMQPEDIEVQLAEEFVAEEPMMTEEPVVAEEEAQPEAETEPEGAPVRTPEDLQRALSELDGNSIYRTKKMPTIDELMAAVSSGNTGTLPKMETPMARMEDIIAQEEAKAEEELEQEHLTDEQKAVFSYFVPVSGMEHQLSHALKGISAHLNREENASNGNLIIMGGKGCGKTVLATSMVRALQKETGKPNSKVGKINAPALNKKDIQLLLKKVQGGCLIIEQAGELSKASAVSLSLLMEQDTSGMLVVLEDTAKGIQKALSLDDGFARKFTESITVPIFTNEDLVAFAESYSKELGYAIDELAVLALHNRIANIERLDQETTLTQIKEIVDEAIVREAHSGLRRFFGNLTAKRFTADDRIVLQEKDFE